MKEWMISFCVFILLAGCREPLSQDVLMKMDVQLRQFVTEGTREDISFSGRYGQEISEVMIAEINATGVRLQTVSGEYFTARGSARQIAQVARMDGVVRLESGKRVKLLDESKRGSR